ncbi:MAG: hypothetical protein E7553_06630 [Ruminococcaceae bacterium]|nr:hypothetical protein [Oscillospiraceae bacterium]
MVLLKNIRIEGSVIKSDIYPENSPKAGRVSVELQTGEIIDYYLPVDFEWCKNHLFHAKRELIAIAKTKEIPKEKLLMWY